MRSTRLFHTSSRRVVRSSLTRFVSLMVIAFLGAGVFAGLWAVSPDMTSVGDDYYNEQNVHDVRLLSTFGFTDDDVEAIRETEGVSGVMASHYVDASGTVDDKDYTFRVDGLPAAATSGDASGDDDYINRVELVEGRLPEANDECVVVESSRGLKNIAVGSTIKLSSASNESLDDTLSEKTLTVVGIVRSADYLSFMVGSTTVGSGSINYVLYVPDSAFTVDGYTDLYVTVEGADALDQFRQAYLDRVSQTTDGLEEVKEERQTLRHDSLWAELEDAWTDYDTAKADAEQSLANALSQLNDGAAQIENAKQSYAEGEQEYNEKSAEADSQLSSARQQIASAAASISSGEAQLKEQESAYATAANQLASARSTLDASEASYQQGLAEYQANEETYEQGEQAYATAADQLSSTRANLDVKEQAYEAALAQAQMLPEGDARDAALAQLAQQKSQLEAAEETYAAAADQLAAKRSELDSAKESLAQAKSQLDAAAAQIASGEDAYAQKAAQLSSAREQLDAATAKLETAKQAYAAGLESYQSSEESAAAQLASARQQLDDAATQITQAEQELSDKQAEYDQAKADADEQLSNAYGELTDKQQTLEDMGDAHWYVFNRTKNEGYALYKNDVERMESLATVFPIIYFVVAALVCLTAMTRMVEEDRTLIGTFKALSFSNRTIASRYLLYAAAASVTGGTLGTLVGFRAIPTIIWHAYGIAYTLPELHPAVYVGIGVASVAAMSAVTLVATLATVMGSLRETPAALMRPKAPKSGKRVLLEHITPLWKRLSFTQKVTFRNLFLNKRRLFTSLVGIAGCTALVVAACGAYARVNTISSDQFDGVWHYDATVGYDEEGADAVHEALDNSGLVETRSDIASTAAEAAAASDADDTMDVTVVSPDDPAAFSSLVTMYDPDMGSEVQMDDSSVIITEKLSVKLGIHAGDSIWVKSVTGDDWYELTVTGVTRNYTMNYVYVGKDAYAQAFGEEPDVDRSLVKLADDATTSELSQALSDVDDVSFLSLTSDTAESINTSIASVNVIVLVLVVTSGLLAFVVVYNLTTINVAERTRELATLEVLGFYDRERYAYILREIWLTAAMGIALGLWLGGYLYVAILDTVEPDIVLLLRTVTPHAYLAAVAIMVVFTWLVNQVVKPSIRDIDMLDALKSVE